MKTLVIETQQELAGFTTNISATGMFIACNTLLDPGVRVRVELVDPSHGFVVEAEVVRIKRVPPELRRVQQAGFGVRFLEVHELIREIMPTLTPPTRETQPELAEGFYRVRLDTNEIFLKIFDRDIKSGGLFIGTNRPCDMDDIVTVEMIFPDPQMKAAKFAARVVHVLTPPEGSPATSAAGIGVQFEDRDAVLRMLSPLADRIRAARAT